MLTPCDVSRPLSVVPTPVRGGSLRFASHRVKSRRCPPRLARFMITIRRLSEHIDSARASSAGWPRS